VRHILVWYSGCVAKAYEREIKCPSTLHCLPFPSGHVTAQCKAFVGNQQSRSGSAFAAALRGAARSKIY